MKPSSLELLLLPDVVLARLLLFPAALAPCFDVDGVGWSLLLLLLLVVAACIDETAAALAAAMAAAC